MLIGNLLRTCSRAYKAVAVICASGALGDGLEIVGFKQRTQQRLDSGLNRGAAAAAVLVSRFSPNARRFVMQIALVTAARLPMLHDRGVVCSA